MEQTGRRKLAAILMADVVEYGRHMGEDEAATIRKLKAHRAVFSKHIQQRYGRVVDAKGDAIMAAFDSVVDAVAASVEIQREIATANDSLPDPRQMQFRIGINLGDIVEEPDSIYGDGVTVAARLETLAEPDGICISRNVHDQVEGKLPLKFEYLGEQQVKTQTVRAYRVVVPEGAEMPEPTPQSPASWVRSWRIPVLAASVVVLVAAGSFGTWLTLRSPPEDPILAMPGLPSIAVLPFVNMSGDPEQEYFADGITDTLITDLSKLRNLVVIARNSAFTYKGKAVDVREVGEKLGVRYVLEGGVQRSGDRLRFNVQLVDAETGNHLWAERYDRTMEDIFDIQDEIVGQIVTELDVKLIQGEDARLFRRATSNAKAYEYFVKGYEIFLGLSKQALERAIIWFEKALAEDPNYTSAIAWVGWTHLLNAEFGYASSLEEGRKRAEAYAERALAIDETEMLALLCLGRVHLGRSEFDESLRYIRRALQLYRNSAHVSGVSAWPLTAAGYPEDGIHAMKQAFLLNPIPQDWYYNDLGIAMYFSGRYEEAASNLEEAVKRMPGWPVPHNSLIVTYMALGRVDEARKLVSEILKKFPNFSLDRFYETWPMKDREGWDVYIARAKEAGLK